MCFLPFIDSKRHQNCTSAQQNYLMVDCVAAEITRESAVQQGTHAKQARAWKRWCKYNKCIGNNDLFLKHFSRHQRIKIIRAFALALQEGRFLGPAYDRLFESTIQSQVPFHMYARPSEKTASQTHPSTKMPGLDSFYSNSIGASKTQTQQRNTKRPSQCVSSKRSEKRQSLSSPSQFPDLPALQSSLHANLANTSRYQLPTNAEQQSFDFTTSDSSRTVNSSATMMQN